MSPETHIQEISRHFTAGRYDLLTPVYAFPLPIFIDGQRSVAAQPSALWAFFQTLHSHLSAAGMPGLEGRLVSVELPRQDRFRLWADWYGHGPGGRRLVLGSVCFNRGTPDRFRTEMIQLSTPADLRIADLLVAA